MPWQNSNGMFASQAGGKAGHMYSARRGRYLESRYREHSGVGTSEISIWLLSVTNPQPLRITHLKGRCIGHPCIPISFKRLHCSLLKQAISLIEYICQISIKGAYAPDQYMLSINLKSENKFSSVVLRNHENKIQKALHHGKGGSQLNSISSKQPSF